MGVDFFPGVADLRGPGGGEGTPPPPDFDLFVNPIANGVCMWGVGQNILVNLYLPPLPRIFRPSLRAWGFFQPVKFEYLTWNARGNLDVIF